MATRKTYATTDTISGRILQNSKEIISATGGGVFNGIRLPNITESTPVKLVAVDAEGNLISTRLTSSTEPLRYKALINQTHVWTDSGLLEVGKTYNIQGLSGRDDFSNVGYIIDGEDFVATETTPTNWTNGTIVSNMTDSQPVVSVLENSLTITATFNFRLGVKGGQVGVIELFNPNSSLSIDKTFLISNGTLGNNLSRDSDSLIILNATDIIALGVLIEVYP